MGRWPQGDFVLRTLGVLGQDAALNTTSDLLISLPGT